MSGPEILTVAEMSEADRLTIGSGVASLTLMESAGSAVADAVDANYPVASVLVLCGPGNNGGDGFCAASHLRKRGYDVRASCLAEPASLEGDAAEMARRWRGPLSLFTPDVIEGATLIIDAIFGAGLSRPLDGPVAEMARAVNASRCPALAVDVPTGLHGDMGRPLDGKDGVCFLAERTVTFFRKKPGHVLLPGRFLCGKTDVADIGIAEWVLNIIRPRTFDNGLAQWRAEFPRLRSDAHKYQRGHAIVVSGPIHATGAARLAARGALRVGAGLVSVASLPEAVAVNAAQLTAIMVKPFDGPKGLSGLLADKRFNAAAIGPGCGVGARTQDLVAAVLASGAAAVLDADALTSFAEDPNALFRQLRESCVLTPHEGEFERVFPGLLETMPSKLAAAREAARLAGCVLLLKGPDTIIAGPDGRAAINANAPPWLATAGAGDVLTGMIAGLMAQGMKPFDAASAAAWLHGEAATRFGLGLIAEDIPEQLPAVLKAMMTNGADSPASRR
ncbi:MAG TPA: NAD(P)H-hydrate dehydratase [Micropepsaceae bacterium]|nr:NAD(P)H-hydrate dehydratase [Micropepsaceae bacterium]